MPRMFRALGEAWRVLLGKKTAGRALTVFPDDIFIVSYPRSGNTWTRFLIGNLVYQDESITFANVESRIPEIYLFPDRVLRAIDRPRILKSHESFDPRYQRIIYVVRDPRDVAVSCYHYAIKRKSIAQDYPIEEFVPRFIAAEFDVRWGLGCLVDRPREKLDSTAGGLPKFPVIALRGHACSNRAGIGQGRFTFGPRRNTPTSASSG